MSLSPSHFSFLPTLPLFCDTKSYNTDAVHTGVVHPSCYSRPCVSVLLDCSYTPATTTYGQQAGDLRAQGSGPETYISSHNDAYLRMLVPSLTAQLRPAK